MSIVLQYFDSCPNWRITDQRIREVIAAHNLDMDYNLQLIESPEAAEKYDFHGSPSILVDGIDPFATADTSVAFACRIYRTESGHAEAPTVEQIAGALGV